MKIDEATKILALTECLLLWDYIAEHGCTKSEAICDLHEAGVLEKDVYRQSCPLCDRLRDEKGHCTQCIWPGKGDLRCCDGPPFIDYFRSLYADERKKVGRAMLKFLEAIDV